MCPARCGRDRRHGQYLCGVCWGSLPALTRRALSRRDTKATARLRQLHSQLGAGTPLSEIKVTL